jgi:hypothetical protein
VNDMPRGVQLHAKQVLDFLKLQAFRLTEASQCCQLLTSFFGQLYQKNIGNGKKIKKNNCTGIFL